MATYSRKLKDAAGDYIAPATRSKVVYFDDNTTLDKLTFYPVGSIYQSTSSTSPASIFGGTWEKIENRFLFGSGTKSVGDTGGEETHLLTNAELPIFYDVSYGRADNDSPLYRGYFDPSIIYSNGWNTGTVKNVPLNNGGGGSHNNMPPYYVINIWRRTA